MNWRGGAFGWDRGRGPSQCKVRNENSNRRLLQGSMPDGRRRLVAFMATGILNTVFGYAIYVCLVLLGLPLWGAVLGATTLGFIFNFFSYGELVFGSSGLGQLPRFLVVYASIGLLNILGLKLLEHVATGPLLSQALLLPVLAVTGYAGMRRFVFSSQMSVEPRNS